MIIASGQEIGIPCAGRKAGPDGWSTAAVRGNSENYCPRLVFERKASRIGGRLKILEIPPLRSENRKGTRPRFPLSGASGGEGFSESPPAASSRAPPLRRLGRREGNDSRDFGENRLRAGFQFSSLVGKL